MSLDLPPGRLTAFVLLYGRVSLGAYFAVAGWGKVQGGVSNFVNGTYAKLTPGWLPESLAVAYGHALPFLELAAGVALAVGLLGRLAAIGCALMLLSFLMAAGWTDERLPFSPNVVLLGLALVLAATGPGRASVDGVLGGRQSP